MAKILSICPECPTVMRELLAPIAIFILMEILGIVLISYSSSIVVGLLLLYVGFFLFLMWIVLLTYSRISKKIEIDNEIQYFIGMFSGIFGGSIVLLADKLFYGQTKWNPSSFAVSVIEFFTVFLLIYVVGLVIVDFHVKSLKKRKKREG